MARVRTIANLQHHESFCGIGWHDRGCYCLGCVAADKTRRIERMHNKKPPTPEGTGGGR